MNDRINMGSSTGNCCNPLISTTECASSASTALSSDMLTVRTQTASTVLIDDNYTAFEGKNECKDTMLTSTTCDINSSNHNSSNSTSSRMDDQILLGTKLVGDVVIAVSVTALAAPFLTVIDKALVQRSAASVANTSNQHLTVWTSMRSSIYGMVQQPMKFLKSSTFLWMWGTYAATYTAANTLRTLLNNDNHLSTGNTKLNSSNVASSTSKRTQHVPPLHVYLSSGTALLIGTSVVNSTASVLKDRAYAQLYGNSTRTSSTAIAVPKITYGLWILRDLTVIGAAFVLPTHVSNMYQQYQNNSATTSKYHLSDATTLRIAQVGTPVMAQVIAGPLHYIGYDCYNRNLSSISLQYQVIDRLRNLQQSLGQVIVARMIRIIPGYGIAGVFNTELLNRWKTKVVLPLSQKLQNRYENVNMTSRI